MARRRLRNFATATPLSPLLCPLSCFFLSTGVLRASLFRRAPPARSPTAGLIAHRCRQLGNRLIRAFRDTSVRPRSNGQHSTPVLPSALANGRRRHHLPHHPPTRQRSKTPSVRHRLPLVARHWRRAGSPPSQKSNWHAEHAVPTPVTMVTVMFLMLLAMAKRRLCNFSRRSPLPSVLFFTFADLLRRAPRHVPSLPLPCRCRFFFLKDSKRGRQGL